MVDWATVALSSITSAVGILLTVLLERRRENLKRIEDADRRIESLDGRLRAAEQDLVTLRPAGAFFSELATAELKSNFRPGKGQA